MFNCCLTGHFCAPKRAKYTKNKISLLEAGKPATGNEEAHSHRKLLISGLQPPTRHPSGRTLIPFFFILHSASALQNVPFGQFARCPVKQPRGNRMKSWTNRRASTTLARSASLGWKPSNSSCGTRKRRLLWAGRDRVGVSFENQLFWRLIGLIE